MPWVTSDETDELGPGPPIGAIGWHGPHQHDDPDVVALRAELAGSTGLA